MPYPTTRTKKQRLMENGTRLRSDRADALARRMVVALLRAVGSSRPFEATASIEEAYSRLLSVFDIQ